MTGAEHGAGIDQLPPVTRSWVILLNRVGLPIILLAILIGVIIGKVDSPLMTMANTQVRTELALTSMTSAMTDHDASQLLTMNQLIRLALASCVNDNLARHNALGAQICTAGLGPKQHQDKLINQALVQHQEQALAHTR